MKFTFYVFQSIDVIQPLFPGKSESDQLHKIFSSLGTPNEDIYAGIVDLPEYRPDFKVYPTPENLSFLAPKLDAYGIELLSVRREKKK